MNPVAYVCVCVCIRDAAERYAQYARVSHIESLALSTPDIYNNIANKKLTTLCFSASMNLSISSIEVLCSVNNNH